MSSHPIRDYVAKRVPVSLTGGQWTGTQYVDAFKRNRIPTPNELMAELKNTAWTCASINASVCASFPPTLYVVTERRHPAPKCATKAVPAKAQDRLRRQTHLQRYLCKADRIEQVVEHPLLDLLQQVNPVHNSFRQ